MKKILIIEDDAGIRDNVNDILTLHNYKVIEAPNGNEGLVRAITESPDLIISDVMMPGLDGFQLMEHLNKNKDLRDVPIIFLTARTHPEDFRRGLKLGANDYIIKPFSMEELLDSVKFHLNKVEHQQHLADENFKLIFENPFTGVFYYKNDGFASVNSKLLSLLEYTFNELNHKPLKEIIVGNTEVVIDKLSQCYKGILNVVQVKGMVMSKGKKAIDVEIFAKHIKISNVNSVIGNIIECNHHTEQKNSGSKAEVEKIIEYFDLIHNTQLAQEISNASKMIEMQTDLGIEKVKEMANLTEREMEVLKLICEGCTNTEIADKLFISARTVDNHRANLLSKTGTKNTAHLVAFSIKNKLVIL